MLEICLRSKEKKKCIQIFKYFKPLLQKNNNNNNKLYFIYIYIYIYIDYGHVGYM